MTDSDHIRIAVAIARSGIASRRGAEVYVRERRVAVDGRVTTDLSLRVDPGSQRITLDGEPLPRAEPLRYYALNKPRGVLSTARDDRGRRTVVDLLPGNAPRCVPVGRLDLDSEGLMLLSNDGPLIGALLHPSAEIQRVYLAEVIGSPTDDSLDVISSGIEDEGERLQAKPARSRRPGRLLRDGRSTSWITLTLHTGTQTRVAAPVRRDRPPRGHTPASSLRPADAARPRYRDGTSFEPTRDQAVEARRRGLGRRLTI